MRQTREKGRLAVFMLLVAVTICCLANCGGSPWSPEAQKTRQNMKDKIKGKIQDFISGFPDSVLKLQSSEVVNPSPIDDAISISLAVAKEAALIHIDTAFYDKGRRLEVPNEFKTIQEAISVAKAGDVVVVKAGIYYELITMKDGVRLVSDSAEGGDELVRVPGAKLLLPRRAMSTILDGSKAQPSSHGMIDFVPGSGRHTIVDGFTIQNLPKQDHHQPGHAHAINVRGASPIIMNCYVRKNGSTGIGNHVMFEDQGKSIATRDFRWDNVTHRTAAVIYNNVIVANYGLGIGCNHFSAPIVLGNEIFENDDSGLAEHPSPGIGMKHGASPIIVGNFVHDNPGGGILGKLGEPQGANSIDRPIQPTIQNNVVFRNGKDRPAIACAGGGSQESPAQIIGNFIYDAPAVGIALLAGSVGIVEDNLVAGSGGAGITIEGATAIRLNRNKVTQSRAPGFVIVNGSKILEMLGNAADSTHGPKFMLKESTITTPKPPLSS